MKTKPAKARASDYSPDFRAYASSAAFRLELSSHMIEFLLWLQGHPQTIETCGELGHPECWHRHPSWQYAKGGLFRRGLIFHRYVEEQPASTPAHEKKPGLYLTGPTKKEGPGWYQVGMTRAGELATALAREAGWGRPEQP